MDSTGLYSNLNETEKDIDMYIVTDRQTDYPIDDLTNVSSILPVFELGKSEGIIKSFAYGLQLLSNL